jgi:hypothetical protein
MSLIEQKIIHHDFCLYEIISYLDSIFDYKTLLIVNKNVRETILIKNKMYLRLISEGNLGFLTKSQLNLSFYNFKSQFLLSYGFVLSGSTMLYSIVGKNWGFHKSDNNNDNVFSSGQIDFIHNQGINKEPDDYDLYINTSTELTKSYYDLILKGNVGRDIIDSFSITDNLEKIFHINLDYKFPDAGDDIHYLMVHIQNLNDINLRFAMLSKICKKHITDITDVTVESNIGYLKRIFDVMYNYRFDILKTYSDLHDVNNAYYNKINVMRLKYYNNDLRKKIKLQVIFNKEYESRRSPCMSSIFPIRC